MGKTNFIKSSVKTSDIRSTSAGHLKRRGRSTRSTAATTAPSVILDLYQTSAVRWLLAHPFAGVFLDPGLGKTVIILMAYWLLRRAKLVDWLLVVAPMRACYLVWPEEVKKWQFPFTVEILHGPKKDEAIQRKADIYVTSYETLEWLHPHIATLRARGRGWLVNDESSKLKHPGSLRHRLIKTMLECFGRRTNATGTPLPNGYMDLFGQTYILDLGARFSPYITHFRRKYFRPVTARGTALELHGTEKEQRQQLREAKKAHAIARWVPTKEGRRAIDDKLKDICIRFSDAELGLKAPRYDVIRVELPPAARRVYAQLDGDFSTVFADAGHVLVPNAGALGVKLRQVANGGVIRDDGRVQELHTAKADALVDLVEGLEGQSMLIGYEFTADKERFVKALSAAGYVMDTDLGVVAGGMPFARQLGLLRAFNAGELQLVMCQYQTVAHALNLQAHCRHVCFTGMIWDLEIIIQFLKRVHRRGQMKQVVIHQLVALGTRDETVMAATRVKNCTQQRFFKMLEDYRQEHY